MESNPTEFQTSVINIKKVTVHYILIIAGNINIEDMAPELFYTDTVVF